MSERLELHVLSAGSETVRIPLEESEVLLGRSGKGVRIQDALVSVEHAAVFPEGGRWFVRDLGSLSGTYVDGQRVGDNPLPITSGSKIRIGNTTVEVHQTARSRLRLYLTAAVGTVLALVVYYLVELVASPIVYAPMLGFPTSAGPQLAPVPESFIREFGRDHRNLKVRRSTDYDHDGNLELWLPWEKGAERVVEVESDSHWRSIGLVPSGCLDLPGDGLPTLKCPGGVQYVFDGVRYVLARQDGVVAWMPRGTATGGDRAGKGTAAPEFATPVSPVPFRFTFVNPEKLAGFLEERGVREPVHYIVCEQAVSGLAAQALTESGALVPLQPGCIRAMDLDGVGVRSFGGDLPVMLAFTATGYRALVEDLRLLLTGSNDSMFGSVDGSALAIAALSTDPEPYGARVRLIFKTSLSQPWSPLAGDAPIGAGRSMLLADDGNARPRSNTVVLSGDNPQRIDPPGCSDLRVDTAGWHCATRRLCRSGSTFLTVTDVGCGEEKVVLTLSYGERQRLARVGDVQLLAVNDALRQGGQIDVLRSRVAWRLLPGKPPPPPELPPSP